MTDNNDTNEKKKKTAEETRAESLYKTYCGKEKKGQVLSVHDFNIDNIDKNGKIRNPTPDYIKLVDESKPGRKKAVKQVRERASGIVASGIYGRLKDTLFSVMGKKSGISDEDLKKAFELHQDEFISQVPVFVPRLNLYGNPHSIASYLAKSATVTKYFSPGKLENGTSYTLEEQEMRGAIVSRIRGHIIYSITDERNVSPVFITYRNIISGDYNILDEDEVEFNFQNKVSADEYKHTLEYILTNLFKEDGESEVEVDDLFKMARNRYLLEELLMENPLNENKYKKISLKKFVDLDREERLVSTIHLTTTSLMKLAFLSKAIESITFVGLPADYKDTRKVPKVTKGEDNKEETTEVVEEFYPFINTKLFNNLTDTEKELMDMKELPDGPLENESKDDVLILDILEYSNITGFNVVSKVMNLSNAPGSASGPKTILNLIFQRFRAMAGYKIDGTVTQSTSSNARKPWLELALDGRKSMDISDLEIKTTKVAGVEKFSLVGFLNASKPQVRVFNDAPRLSQAEEDSLIELLGSKNADYSTDSAKRLMLKAFKYGASVSPGLLKEPARETQEKKAKRLEKKRVMEAAIARIIEELGGQPTKPTFGNHSNTGYTERSGLRESDEGERRPSSPRNIDSDRRDDNDDRDDNDNDNEFT